MSTPAVKNGCFDRPPYKQTTELRDHHGRLVASWPFRMAEACQYTHTELGAADQRCEGCKHRVTEKEGTC